MSNFSSESSSEHNGGSDGLFERPLVGRVALIYKGSAAEPRRFLESDMA